MKTSPEIQNTPNFLWLRLRTPLVYSFLSFIYSLIQEVIQY